MLSDVINNVLGYGECCSLKDVCPDSCSAFPNRFATLLIEHILQGGCGVIFIIERDQSRSWTVNGPLMDR